VASWVVAVGVSIRVLRVARARRRTEARRKAPGAGVFFLHSARLALSRAEEESRRVHVRFRGGGWKNALFRVRDGTQSTSRRAFADPIDARRVFRTPARSLPRAFEVQVHQSRDVSGS